MKKPPLQAPSFAPSRPRAEADISDRDARFAAAAAFESKEGMTRRIATGSVRTVNLDTVDPATLARPRVRKAEVSLSTTIPQAVKTELRRRYAESGLTIRVQILLALRAQGFEIEDEALHDERQRR